MWSVLSERVDVYLGTGLVLVRRDGAPLWTHEPPTTLPLADVLRQVDQTCERAQSKPWRLHVTLSATLCPPLVYTLPPGVKRHQEVQAIALASAAQVWGLSTEQFPDLVCSLAIQHPGLAATMLKGTQQQIAQWALEHKGRLNSLQPLWATATQAAACTRQTTQRLAVLEPDALTLLNLDNAEAPRAISWPGQHAIREARSQATAWWGREGENESETVDGAAMVFVKGATLPRWADGPSVWKDHWSPLP